MHEYNDTQHAALTFGPLGKWPELKPPTNPRRQNQHGAVKGPSLAPTEVENLFEVTDKYDLDPKMLVDPVPSGAASSDEHTSELQSLMRISYAVFCLKKKTHNNT